MSTDYKFEGWVGLDANAAKGNMVWQSYEPKAFQETDIDVSCPRTRFESHDSFTNTNKQIEITHSGICGSDIHTLQSGWGPTNYPCVVGHEIVGKAVRVGKDVKNGVKVGDRVGVGAQSGACLKGDCPSCANGSENYCQVQMTYVGLLVLH
jgi:alcohol dehydrogenase (NADP+)